MSGAAALRNLVDGGHACLSLARVAKHEGETDFWAVNADGDLEIQVVTHQHQAPITAILGPLFGWRIPLEGEEVVVAHAEGDFEGDAVIVAAMSSGDVPGDLSPTVMIVRAPPGGKVVVHDGAGAQSLATKQDVQELRDWVAAQFDPNSGHTHKAIVPAQPTNIVPVPAPLAIPPQPAGTSVLEGK